MLRILYIFISLLPIFPFNFSCNCASAALAGSAPELFNSGRNRQGHLGFCENFPGHKHIIFQSKIHKFLTVSEANEDHNFKLKT